jgi:hypothetical protein
MVALHETEVAAYASGWLYNSNCTRAPYSEGTVSCLIGARPVAALLSNRANYNPSVRQPFDANQPLAMVLDGIPADNLAQVHLHQANATYDFDPRCVGNMLTGDDQFGNHWALAFGLHTDTQPR